MIATSYSPEQWALASATALGAVGSFITVIFNAKRGKRNEDAVQQVHTLVNANSEKQETRIDQLASSLTDAGVEVPPREDN